MLAGATLEEHALPPGVSNQDPYFGEVTIFPADFTAELPIVADAGASEVRLIAHFQGCAEQGICYPPAKKTLSISLPSIISDAAASENPNLPASGEARNNTDPANKEAVSTGFGSISVPRLVRDCCSVYPGAAAHSYSARNNRRSVGRRPGANMHSRWSMCSEQLRPTQ